MTRCRFGDPIGSALPVPPCPKLTDDIIERAMEKAGGNKAKAARLLGVGRATLYNFMNGKEREPVMAEG